MTWPLPPPSLLAPAGVALALLATADSARADDPAEPVLAPTATPHRLQLPPGFREVGPVDVAVTATVFAAWLGLQLGVSLAEEPRWKHAPALDRSTREALVAASPAGRNSAALWSEILWIGPMVWAGTDVTVVPLLTDRGNWDVAWQTTVVSGEAFVATGFFARAGQIGFARERPDAAPCRKDEDYSGPCGGGNTASFPSGHSAGAMVGAGLVCAHHLELPLYGGVAQDVGACVVATSLAATGSMLRIVADRHYLTDVLAGGGFGFAAGLGLPMLLHYDPPWHDDGGASVTRVRVIPGAPGADGGASLAGHW